MTEMTATGRPFPAVEHGRPVHLLEQEIGVPWVRADEEALKVLVDQPAGGRAYGSVVLSGGAQSREERTRARGLRERRSALGVLPPKPVAKPTVPSVASISTKKEPSTLMPQLVREARYWSHLDAGVDIGESISLRGTHTQSERCVGPGQQRLAEAHHTNDRP